MTPNQNRLLKIIGIPLLFAFILRFTFNVKSWESVYTLMSVSFIFLVPFAIGALTIYFSNIEKVRQYSYCIMMPWAPIFVFLVVTLFLSIEGWGCWFMILPIFMMAASIGGMVAGHYKVKRHDKERMYISILVLLPLFLSPIEPWIESVNNLYEAYTYIDLHADKAKIWRNVNRVRAIKKEQDKGWLTNSLGFPRPVRAELNYNGVGGYRKAIFEKGRVFHEQVTQYEDERRMRFTIKANPYEIPSTTMDEHVVIGGNYFDVMDGTYVLQKLNANTYRLHLYSHFNLTTTFNFYASFWAGFIMKDIQNNILQVIKERVE